MAEEFQAGICGGTAAATTWWNPSRNTLSPCSVAGFGFMNDHHHHLNQMGSYGWSSSSSSDYDHIVDLKSSSSNNNNNIVTTRSSNCDQESNNSVVTGESSVIFQKTTDSDSGGNSSILMDSAFNMMGGYGGLPSSSTSSPTDWNHALLRENVRVAEENNYSSLIHDDMINNHDPSSSSSTVNISQGLFGYPSSLLQGLLEPDHQTQIQHQQQQQSSLFSNQRPSINNFLSTTVPASPCWSKPTAAIQKQQPNNLQFTNSSTTPFWNTSSSTTTGFYPSSQPQTLSPTVGSKPNNYSSLTTKCNNNREEGTVVKKASTEPAFKRPRIETPSPLPTFKVRKEKLGDRITALQQLVSPFGKTDTASVLHEAIEYIKFLHDQVSVLSTPYMKQGNPIQQQQQQQGSEKLMKETDAPNQDLRSRGLCLVPISSTFPVANETTPDFWTPTFGGTFR